MHPSSSRKEKDNNVQKEDVIKKNTPNSAKEDKKVEEVFSKRPQVQDTSHFLELKKSLEDIARNVATLMEERAATRQWGWGWNQGAFYPQ